MDLTVPWSWVTDMMTVCAYPSFRAMLEVDTPEVTSVCLLVDKEEIGSVGATGMQSRFFWKMQ